MAALIVVPGGCGDSSGGGGGTSQSTTATSTGCVADDCPTSDPPGRTTSNTVTTTGVGESTAAGVTSVGSTDESSTTGDEADGPMVLYVAGGGRVSVWDIAEDGTLTERSAAELGETVGPLAVDPSRAHLYAAVLPEQSIHAFSIDPGTGDLTEIDTLELDHTPVYVTIDRSDAHLLTAGFSEDILEVYPIEAAGTLGDTPTQSQTTAARPHLILVDPSNEHVFVPCRDADVVQHYLYDAVAGTLSAAEPPAASVPDGTGPRHLVLAPDGEQAFLSGEFNSTLNIFDYEASMGMLTFDRALSTLPEGFEGENTTADVEITPSGRAVYVSNRGHDSLARFNRDAAGGVEAQGQVPTEARPREFDITPDGHFTFVAGRDTGMLASYTIGEDGSLDPGPVYDVGSDPRWVLAVELPARRAQN